jgi:hypothetical protein
VRDGHVTDTAELLTSLGMTPAQVDELVSTGAIA